MLCKAFDKEAPCTAEATFTVFWPGQETVSCDRHHEGQQRIAGFMGFALSSRPIPKPEVLPPSSNPAWDLTFRDKIGEGP